MSSQSLPYPDPEAHEPGCAGNLIERDPSDPSGYLDIFCECHRYTEPRRLANGIDIAWPAGWDKAQATAWRQAHGLQQPTQA